MSFKLNSIITIGKYRFRGVNDVHIKKSIHSITDTCNIKIPASARLRTKNDLITDSVEFVETSKQFKPGDKVVVQLGYNGNYNQEFVGFVRKLNFTVPLEVECEGYVYQLRQPLPSKVFNNVDYRVIVKYIIQGTDIVLSPEMSTIQSFPVDNFRINAITGAQALEDLQKHLKNTLIMFFVDNKLYVGLDDLYNNGPGHYIDKTNTVKYLIDWNTIKSNDLKMVDPGNITIKVTVGNGKKDGTVQMIVGGDKTSTHEQKLTVNIASDPTLLASIANIHANQQKYLGYEGKVTAFGLPFCQHSWKIIFTSKRYKELEGSYLCDAIEVRYNMSGFRRIPSLGHKIA